MKILGQKGSEKSPLIYAHAHAHAHWQQTKVILYWASTKRNTINITEYWKNIVKHRCRCWHVVSECATHLLTSRICCSMDVGSSSDKRKLVAEAACSLHLSQHTTQYNTLSADASNARIHSNHSTVHGSKMCTINAQLLQSRLYINLNANLCYRKEAPVSNNIMQDLQNTEK